MIARFAALASKPLLVAKRSVALVAHRTHSTIYRNPVCDREGCNNPHRMTETTYCDVCVLLPLCDDCGYPVVDCDDKQECVRHQEPDVCDCTSDYDCGCRSTRRYHLDPDRERWGCQ